MISKDKKNKSFLKINIFIVFEIKKNINLINYINKTTIK